MNKTQPVALALVIMSSAAMAQNIDIGGAATSTFLTVAIRGLIAFCIFKLLTINLTRKTLHNPANNGRWVGACLMGFSILIHQSFNKSDSDFYFGIVLVSTVWFILGFAIGYAWRTFKPMNEVVSQHTKTEVNDEKLWERASVELNSDARNKGLWAKFFVESNGDESKAKIQYLKIRFDEESKKLNLQNKRELSKRITSTPTPVMSTKIALSQDIFAINPQPRVDSVDYNQYTASSLLSNGMFEKAEYKDRTLFYLHNGDVASISGQLVKVFDSDVFLKKAIDKGTIGDRHPSGLLVSFDKDSIK